MYSQYGDEEIEVLLVGNKSDLVNARATTVEEAEAFVLKEGLIGVYRFSSYYIAILRNIDNLFILFQITQYTQS